MSESQTPISQPAETDPRDRTHPGSIGIFRDYIETIAQPEFRPIFYSVLGVLLIGTVVFHQLENWSLLDSLYFSVVTLATVGYGDLHPTNKISKIFVIIYIFVGVGTLGVFISAVSRASLRRSMDRRQQLHNIHLTPQEEQVEDEVL